jgi:hypothetical protein
VNCRGPNFTAPGAGFNERDLMPGSGMLVEDIIAASPGAVTATGHLDANSRWVFQLVTFR